jgi:predicted unusual protein kinase regulating ubiquinone biosynthesis (AarF/ABC1/UbiB family)
MSSKKPSSTQDPAPGDGEAASLGGRVRRYARVSSALGGVAVRYAGGKIGGGGDEAARAAALKQVLGGLKGPLMKVAQILATIPDALPEAYAEELRQLQSNAPPMGWPFVRRRMRSELGDGWQQRFAAFEREPAAAASLGQVHRAEDHDGTLLACKLQYPDMASAVEADMRQLNLAFSIYRRYDPSIDASEIHAELEERLKEELDYSREARHMALYHNIMKDEPGVSVPESRPRLSTGRLLTMTWLDGEPMMDFLDGDPPQEARDRVAMNMFRGWYLPFYGFGVIHGDPHLGNYTVREDHGVNLLDFGCIRVFPPQFVTGVIDLYKAIRDDDGDLAVHAYETWGFRGLDPEVIEVLNMWAAFVYAPLLEDRHRRIQETEGGVYGRAVAMKVHGELKRLGGVKPPREFLLMDRAAIGLGSVFLRLKAELNWHRLFHDLIVDVDQKALARSQKAALKAVGLA